MITRLQILLYIIAIVYLAGCADVGVPPGGPEDKQGPSVLEAIPKDGAIGVKNLTEVQIKFSESIQVPKNATVLVSPRPATPPKVDWRGQAVTLSFDHPLEPDKTYVVSLPPTLVDLRGNKPDSAVTVAFSTGTTLDSCSISGRIFDGDKPAAGMAVALYATSPAPATQPFDSIFPDYLTATGKNGDYLFRHLPAAQFTLIAFQKSGRDDRFRPGRDRFALTDRNIDLSVVSVLTNINASMTGQDTTPTRIVSAVINNDRALELRLSKPIIPEAIKAADSLDLRIGETHLKAVPTFPPDSESFHSVTAYFGNLPAGVAQLNWRLEPSRPSLAFDSLRLPAARDTSRPRLVFRLPSDIPVLRADTAVHLLFSEPIDFTRLTDTSVRVVSVRDSSPAICDRVYPSASEIVLLPKGMIEGSHYRIDLHEPLIADLAGNALGDSTRHFFFSILNTDSLGWIDGTVRTSPKDSANHVRLSFRRTADSRNYQLLLIKRTFKQAMPAGKYIVSGFVDRNNNGRFDRGSIFPFVLSEPFLPFSDTISVRARFETGGVELEFK